MQLISYAGRGLQVKKIARSTTVHILPGGKVIAEYEDGAAPGSPTREYVYSGSPLLATIEGGTTKYHHPDHLSARVTTDAAGNSIGEQGHYPFGEQWYSTGFTPKQKFTSYERDGESGLDYAMFRYDSTRLGRFMTPDPIAGSIADPQSLNRYAYVRNDPANLVDPLGMAACLAYFFYQITKVDGVIVDRHLLWVWVVACSASDGGLRGPAMRDPAAQPRPTVHEKFWKEFLKALELTEKLECARFLRQVTQRGLLLAAGVSERSQLDAYGGQPLYDDTENPFVFSVLSGLAGRVEAPRTDPREGDIRTIARADYSTQTVTFYNGFYEKGKKGRAQTLLHEGIHLYFPLTDQQLAEAAGVAGDNAGRASANFQKELEKHCK